MDAKLIYQSTAGPEVRLCTRKNQTWPGYHDSLGATGYWVGTYSYHRLTGKGDWARLEALAEAKANEIVD